MKNTVKVPFMVTMSIEIQLNQLRDKVRYLYHTKVSLKNYITKKRISQCHRYQEEAHDNKLSC